MKCTNETTHKCISKELASGLKILGDMWVLCIMHALEAGPMRFNELARAVPQANPVTLVSRLKKLEKEKIIERKAETLDKLSVVYSLTKKGEAALPVVEEIKKFVEKFHEPSSR